MSNDASTVELGSNVTLFFFVRHGEAVANVKKILAGRRYPSPLTRKGCEQITSLGRQLRRVRPKAIYSSPVERAMKSAQILGQILKLPVSIEDRLTEIDMGVLEGSPQNSLRRIQKKVINEIFEKANPHRQGEYGLEKFTDVQDRVAELIHQLTRTHRDESLILATHLDPIRAAVASALNLDKESILNLFAYPGSVSILERHGERSFILGFNICDMQRYTGVPFFGSVKNSSSIRTQQTTRT